MAEQEFWSSQFLNRLNWKGAVSYEKEKYSRLCLKVLNLLSSIMCLLTYIYNPLLQAIKKKSMETGTIITCTDVQNRRLFYIALLSCTLTKD